MEYKNYLSHHGVQGQKWGVQNGPPYPLNRKNIFISGSSKTQLKDSPYFRPDLNESVKAAIDDIIKSNYNVIIGDAPGIDSQVQNYLKEKQYKKVTVYGPQTGIRYTADRNWKQKAIKSKGEIGSKEWLAAKDKVMQRKANEGIAIVLENGGAAATRKNVEALLARNKKVKIFELRADMTDSWIEKI